MQTHRWIATLAICVAGVMASGSALQAQGVTTGAIQGTVTDETGQPVDAAQVQVVNTLTGVRNGAVTNSSGRYLVSGLETGSAYEVTVRRIGFGPVVRERVVVTLGLATRVDVSLSRQAAEISAVRVTGDLDETFSTTSTGVATTVSDSALRRLPTLNRNFTDFVVLTPQIATAQNGGISGGGVNNRFNSIQIDGANESDLFGLGSTGQPGGQARGKSISLEAVKEYQVLLTPFDVRQGNFSGALINAVTKSGTNRLQGTAFYYTRDNDLARDVPYLPEYSRRQYGFSLGGPIVKDRIHFFVSPEWQEEEAPSAGQYVGQGEGFVGDTNLIRRFADELENQNLTAGSSGLLQKQNPLANVFGRVDFQLPMNNRLVVRHNYGYAEDDIFSRTSTSTFALTSNAYFFQSTKNASSAQLFSNFANGSNNELQVNYTTIRDRRIPEVVQPQISVRTPSGQLLVAGSERFSMGNELDQDIFEVRDDFSFSLGSHRLTFGGQAQLFDIRNLFNRDSYGIWQFASVEDFEAGNPPEGFSGSVDLGGGIEVNMEAAQYALFAQDQWSPTPNLTLTYGVRADVPVLSSKPAFTQSVLTAFGRRTDEVPSGNILFSPRLGFNWQIPGVDEQQIRGGVGMFAGRPAFVWLSNAYQNSGSGLALFTCGREGGSSSNGIQVPTYDPTIPPPSECGDGSGPSSNLSLVDLLSEDLNFPQTLRATLGYDRRLPLGFVGSFEGLFTQNLNDFFYTNLGIVERETTDPDGRVMYGTITQNDPSGPPLPSPTSGARVTVARAQAGFNDVIDVKNTSKNYSYNLTAEVRRRFAEAFEFSAAYAFSRVRDVQSPTSSQGISNWRFGRSISGRHNDQNTGISLFDVPHKVILSGTYSFRTKTDLSVIYVGNSGVPFEYIYLSYDANADGATNDLIYVPTAEEVSSAGMFREGASLGGVTYTALEQAEAFEEFVQNSECLSRQRGKILERNSCRSPWQNLVNVSLRQRLPNFGGNELALQLDVFNFMNLLNKEWGAQEFASNFSNPGLLGVAGVSSNDAATQRPTLTFSPLTEEFNSRNASSNYQIQLAARYSLF